jgi:hypothetical protein
MDNLQTNQLPTPSQLRVAYQQCAATFLFGASHTDTRSTSWIGHAARSLALRAVYAGNNDVTMAKTEDAKCTQANWSDFVCLACGTPSYPHHVNQLQASNDNPATPAETSQIILRPLKRGRTRRRRASRSKASQLSRESLLQKRLGGGTNVNNQLRKDALLESKMLKLASFYRLSDGRCRHCVVVKCGHCGNERKRKGVEIKGIRGDCKKQQKNTAQGTKNKCALESSTEKSKSDSFEESNFISLSPFGANSQKKRKGCNDRSSNTKGGPTTIVQSSFSFKNHTQSTLSAEGKKKKAKKAPATKGLMDFLSSLND